MSSSLFYVCTFSLGNYTFMYRCRIADQYCCGHSCCFKQTPPESPHLFSSWYFWSLVLVVLIVFGCIIVSFALSSLKQRADIESWSAFAGTAFNNLATTITGRHGIIQPRLHYQKRSPGGDGDSRGRESSNSSASPSSRGRRGQGSWGRGRPPPANHPNSATAAPPDQGVSLAEVDNSESATSAAAATPSASSGSVATVSGAVKYSQGIDKSSLDRDWVEIQLSPLHPAYKSSWSGNPAEVRLAASTQVFFPPGFINS